MARRDLLAGRAFRADVARTEALWDILDAEVLALSGERMDYLTDMQDARRTALGRPVERREVQFGQRVRAAAQRAREAEAVYNATKRELNAGGGPVDAFEAAVDEYRAAQESLRGSVSSSVETSLSVQRLIRRRAADMQAKAEAVTAAPESQPAAR